MSGLSKERHRHDICKKISKIKACLDKKYTEEQLEKSGNKTLYQDKTQRYNVTGRSNVSLQRGFRQSSRPKRRKLIVPENLCLDSYYGEFTDFIEQFRHAIKDSGNAISIDFLKIKTVTPGAALIFAAELDRWRRTQNVFPRANKINRWSPSVCRTFNEMGLFKLLKVSNPPDSLPDPDGVKIIKFQSMEDQVTELDPGASAKKFREILESTTGISVTESHRKAIYKGLSEVMTNVLSHAYEGLDNTPIPYIKNAWWVSGDYNQNSQELSVYVYDQGIGIPKSFKTKDKWKEMYNDFKNFFKDHHDGNLIDVATGPKTRTKLEHRGKGLRDLRTWIEGSERGELRIMSGSGELRITSDGQTHRMPLSRDLGGTLIHWRIKI